MDTNNISTRQNVLPAIVALLVFALTTFIIVAFNRSNNQQFQIENRNYVEALLSARQVALESSLSRRLNVAYSMAAFAAHNPDAFESKFEDFAQQLYDLTPNVRSIQVAPNAVVRHIYPLAGNEAALGHDLLNDPARRPDVERTIERADLTLAGPVELVQGGLALIGRVPIFVDEAPWEPVIQTEQGQFWGLGVVLIDVPPLLVEADLSEEKSNVSFAVRVVNDIGEPQPVFLGDDALFDEESVRRYIVLSDGTWELAARPVVGWATEAPESNAILIGGGILTLALAVATFFVVRAPLTLQQTVQERTNELAESNQHLQQEIHERKQIEMALRESEEKYRNLFEYANDAIFISDPSTRCILDVNKNAIRRFGYTREELLALTIDDISALPPDRIGTNIRKLQDGDSMLFETIHLPKDGTKMPVEISSRGIVYGGRQVVQSFVRDITERKRVEEVLRENEENLRITLNSIGDAVIATDTEGIITRMNPVAEMLTGWKVEEAKGQSLTAVFCIINKQTRKPMQNPVEKVLQARQVVELADHTVLIAKNGVEYQIADSGAPILDAGGNIIGIVLVFRDVTEKQNAEQERLKLGKLESVGILAGGIAHDFNNLLTGLYGNIELAERLLPDDHRVQKYLKSAMRSMKQATHLTKQLLTFAKGGDPIKETLSLGEVIMEMAQFSLRGSNIKLKANINPDLWLIEADKGQLSQVISNLVINGQQAMPTGGIITIVTENIETAVGRYIQIAVQDEGVGIAPQYLDKIFDPYFSTKQKGNGLGLTSAYSIISKHNGYITVDSQLNQGTTFTIRIPASDKQFTEKSTAEAVIVDVSSVQILVMDDEEIVREMMERMLEMLGHNVTFAVDGQEAIIKYRASYENEKLFDIVITDLTIPGGMGGQEAAREILTIDPQAKIIVSSGYATDPIMANYKDYGFQARVVKPYRVAELQKVIQQVLKT